MVRDTEPTDPPPVGADVRSASSIGVTGQGMTPGTTTLALAEAYAPGWSASKDSGLDQSSHRRLQGWMNAWTATSTDVGGTLAYGPDRYAQLAQKLFLVTVVAGMVWLAIRRPVRRWVGSGWRRLRARLPRRKESRSGHA